MKQFGEKIKMSTLKNIVSILIICVVFSTAFLLNTSNGFAFTLHAAKGYKCTSCDCKRKCVCDASSGAEGHRQEWSVTALDMSDKYQELSIGQSAYTCVFFVDTTETDSNNIKGEGYINIKVSCNTAGEIIYYVCGACETQKIINYSEWLLAARHVVYVIPNPVANQSIIKVEGVTEPCSFSFYLYRDGYAEPVWIYNTSNFTGEMLIDNNFVQYNGIYRLVYTLNGVSGTINFIVNRDNN